MQTNLHTALLVIAITSSALSTRSAESRGPVQVAKVSGFADDAAFLLYLNGSLILTNSVTWKENGTFQSKGEGIAEGDTIRMVTTMSSDPDGRWSEVSMVMPIHKTGVKRSGNSAVLTLPDGKTSTVPLKPGVFPFLGMLGLNLYTRFYDDAKAGKQVLPILIPHKRPIKYRWNRSAASHECSPARCGATRIRSEGRRFECRHLGRHPRSPD